MYTYNGAYAAFAEKRTGSIEKGKAADLAVLSRSLTQQEPDSIKDIKVEMTIIDGQIIYPSCT
jgi:predicted amidohydrolase YtcJ